MTTATETKPSAFAALLEEINGQQAEAGTLAKAIASDDSKIEAAAAEGAADGETDEEKAAREAEAAKGGGETVMKALKVVGENGEEQDGFDATELLKALQAGQEKVASESAAAMTAVLGLVKSQGEMIKSLHEQVQTLGQAGRGRKAVIALTEKPGATEGAAAPAADADKGMSRPEFMAKALQCAEAEMITYRDANYTETLLNNGGKPPEHVLAAVAKLVAKEAAAA